MATKIIHKKSSVASSVPVSADIAPGELALNLADQKIYSKQTDGTIIEMAPSGEATALTETCKNVSGGSLAIGTPVYQSGTAGNAMEVQAARADTAGSMPAVGIITSTLADEAEGTVVLTGFIQGLNTSSFSEGDTLYIGATGGLTTTPPTGEANLVQNIGKVIKVHASNGSIMVTGAGRANATPNLDDGDIFIGNSSGQATTSSLSTEVQTIGDARYVEVAGDTMTGDLSFGDDDKAIFGAGSDLQIYHDGSHSYIKDAGEGYLKLGLSNAGTAIQNGAGKNLLVTDAAAVSLRFNGGQKLNTSATGIAVSGNATFRDNDKAIFGDGSDLQIYHDGSNSIIHDNGTGNLQIRAGNLNILNADATENYLSADNGGALNLFYDNSKKFETTSTGIDVTGNIAVSGTVDGRDVATDGTKLDGIATGATNVTNNNQLTNGAGYVTTDTNTTYSAGTGMSLSGTTFNCDIVNTDTNTNQLTTFQLEDGDGTEVTVSHGKEVKFTEGQGINVNWTDTSTGSDGTPYDMEFALKTNGVRANELWVTGSGTTSQYLRSDGDGSFTWDTPPDTNTDTNTTYTAGTGMSLSGTTFNCDIVNTDTNTTYTAGTGMSLSGTTFNCDVVNTDTNTTYTASTGLNLSGTAFSIENDLRGEVSYIGEGSSDYYFSGTTTHRWYLDGNEDMRLQNTGDLHVDGNVIAYSTTVSDERLKKDIVKIDNALDKVSQLGGYTFEYLNDGKKSAGVIAQEVEKVLPSAIVENKLPLKMGDDDETMYKTVQYDQLTGLLIEAIKELKAEIEVLKGN